MKRMALACMLFGALVFTATSEAHARRPLLRAGARVVGGAARVTGRAIVGRPYYRGYGYRPYYGGYYGRPYGGYGYYGRPYWGYGGGYGYGPRVGVGIGVY